MKKIIKRMLILIMVSLDISMVSLLVGADLLPNKSEPPVAIKAIEENFTTASYEEDVLLITGVKVLTNTVTSSRSVSSNSIDVFTDLSVMNTVTADDMNYIIDHWLSYSSGDSPFKNRGQTFIEASKASGLDPIYILAHAALESAWGTSEIARTKHNYFGIGAYDHAPYENSYHMGDDIHNGIIDGAMWIADNYYNAGQNTLYSMRYNYGQHEYCTSTTWMYEIASIIEDSYEILQDRFLIN